MPTKIIFSEEEIKEIKSLYADGVGTTEISKKFNVSIKTIREFLKKENLFTNRFHSEDFYSKFWEYDADKLYLAKNNGYNCEVVWEMDYKKNKNIVLDLIKKYDTKK